MEFVLSEGWNQTWDDWNFFISNSVNVCKAAEIEGRLIGTICSINYSGDLDWISMVLVDKDFRGKGISRQLLEAVLKELNGHSIKLDATTAGLMGYRKFHFIDEYQIVEMVTLSFKGLEVGKNEFDPHHRLNDKDIELIIELDKQASGADRSVLIRYLCSNFPEKCYVLWENSRIQGYCLGRKGNKYHRIGPVSSISFSDTRKLISQALLQLKGEPVVIDVPDHKKELLDWLGSLGFTEKRYFTRMFLHSNPSPGRKDLVQVIAGPEYG